MNKKRIAIAIVITLFLSGCMADAGLSNRADAFEVTVVTESQVDSVVPEAEPVQTSEAESLEVTETESWEESEETASEKEAVEVEEDMNWQDVFDVPSDEEVDAYTNPNDRFAPCLGGWLTIPEGTKYSEYSIEFKADYAPMATYWCLGQWSMDYSSLEEEYREVHLEPGAVQAYAGFQHNDDGMETIIAFWDIYCTDEAGRDVCIRAERVYPETMNNSEDFGGEGEGAHCLVPYGWEPGHWYCMHVKCVESQETGNTVVEQWVCDMETEEWTLLCSYDLGAKDVLFVSSPAIFMENYLQEYAGGVRSMEVRNAKYLEAATGQWEKIIYTYVSSNGGAPGYEGCYGFGTFRDRIWLISSGVGGDWYNNGKGKADAVFLFEE